MNLMHVTVIIGVVLFLYVLYVHNSMGKDSSPAKPYHKPNIPNLPHLPPGALPEVYLYALDGPVSYSNISDIAAKFGAVPASLDQLNIAQSFGAQWCMAGFVADSPDTAYYPMQVAADGCGNAGVNGWNDPSSVSSVTLFGVKPSEGTQGVVPFSPGAWSMYSVSVQDSSISFN